jgi:hypothetical protein
VKIERSIEGGHERLSLTLQTLDVNSHSKLVRDEATIEAVQLILDSAVSQLVLLLRKIRTHE